MEETTVKIKWSEISYYLFFGLLLFAKGIGMYDGQLLFKWILVLAGLFWITKMLLTPLTIREMVISAGALLLSAIVYRVSGEKGMLLYAMMIVGAKNIPVKRVMAVGLIVWLLSFGGMFVMTSVHLLDSPFKVHEKGGELIIRWGLGSTHPNVLHVSYLLLCMLSGYLLEKKMKLRWLLLLFIGNLYTFLYSVSYTGFIAVNIYLFLCGYWMYRKKLAKGEKVLIMAGGVICVLFSMLAPILLRGKVFEFANRLLNTRLRLSRIYLTQYPFSLFGRKLSEITTYSATMDCSYVFAYVTYGSILFTVLILGYMLLIYRYCREQRGSELCIILACLAAGVTEPFLFNTSFKNISLFFFRDIIYSGKQGKKRKSINLLSKYDREMWGLKPINVQKWTNHMTAKVSRLLLLSFAAGCLVGILGYGLGAQEPKRIIVPRKESDLDESWYTELNLSVDQIKPDDLVYGEIEDGDILMGLTGRAIKLEMLRGAITCGILSGSVCLLIVTGVYYVRKRENGSKE